MMNGINLLYSRASFTLFVCLTLYEGRIHAASISQKKNLYEKKQKSVANCSTD